MRVYALRRIADCSGYLPITALTAGAAFADEPPQQHAKWW